MLSADIAKITKIDESRMPRSWQIVGDIFIAKMPKLNVNEKKAIAEKIIQLFPRIKTVCEISSVEGEFRKPVITKIVGRKTETVHIEHGIKYMIDVSQLMFSKGNEHERHRLEKEVKPKETIIDMFSGIGYFALPLAKCAKRVIAIEKNPVAFDYLKQNIALNRLHNVEPINIDCRDFEENSVADRVLLGYLPNTEEFLSAALRIVKSSGIVHFHNTCHKDNTDIIEEQIKEACAEYGCGYEILSLRKVKDYAPNVYHMVADFLVQKAG